MCGELSVPRWLVFLILSGSAFAQLTGIFSGSGGIQSNSSPAPVIVSFSCTSPITSGQTSNCSWTVVGADTVAGSITVNNGLYSCGAPCPGSANANTAALTTTTTYTIVATNPSVSVQQPFTVVVGLVPTATITPSPTAINLNSCGGACSTTVSWTATNQNTVDIVRNSDGVSKLHCTSSCAGSGNFVDSPTSTTTYTITVVAVGGGTVNTTSVPVVVTPVSGGGSVTDTNRYDNPDNTCNGLATDGGAAPPGNCFYTALAGTPSPGKTVAITAGCSVFPCANDIATIYNGAGVSCGDTITLAAGALWNYGSTHTQTLNSKGCDNAHWITIRTSTLDANLPDQNTQITPCWANIASLAGRPTFSCPGGGPAALAPTISMDGSNDFAIAADHVRFIGIRFTTTAPLPGGTTQLINLTGANHIVFDRMLFSGTPTGDVRRALALSTSQWVAVINSYLWDFHCHSGVAAPCNQSQGIGFGLGTQTLASPVTLCQRGVSTVPAWTTGCPGVYKFVNDYMEASGENLFSGGGGANYVPVDTEIRRSHFFKPLYWNPLCAIDLNGCGTPGSYVNGTAVPLTDITLTSNVVTAHAAVLPANVSVGVNLITVAGVSTATFNGNFSVTVSGSGPYTFTYAKTAGNIGTISGSGTIIAPPFVAINNFELKNGVRVFMEGNIFENSWGGFSQQGYAVLLTPKNQAGNCPLCYVSDVTIRYSVIKGTAAVFQLAGAIDDLGFTPAIGLERVSIHDIVADGQFSDAQSQGSYGIELTFNCNSPSGINDIVFNHISLVKIVKGAWQVGTAAGPSTCVFNRVTFTNSIIDAGQFPMSVTSGGDGCQQLSPSHTPIGIFTACFSPFTAAANAVTTSSGTWGTGFTLFPGVPTIYTAYSSGLGGNYHVTPASGLQNAATDGLDIGGNITKIATETAGIP